MTAELIEMDRMGKLKGDAAYIWMKTKPLEELYDLHDDPYEINNLADCPEHQDKLIELRKALAAWQLEVGDLGFIPEHDLVQMMWPGLVQPETEPVTFSRSGGKLELASATEGASIAWQADGEDDPSHWRLYHKPIEIARGDVIRARAVRIGYKTSGITIFGN